MTQRRPQIGIDLDHEFDGRRWVYKLPKRYVDIVKRAGGQPVLIPPGDPRDAAAIVADLDGLLMTGGDDVHPAAVGRSVDGMPMRLLSTHRESFVLGLARAALDADIPVLGVCLGTQALALASGGDIWFDLYSEFASENGEPVEHRSGAEHTVIPEPNGWIDRCWQGAPQRLISHHHQATRRLGAGMRLEARAEDGVIEAFSDPSRAFFLAVQWHPEVQPDSLGGLPIVEALVQAASVD